MMVNVTLILSVLSLTVLQISNGQFSYFIQKTVVSDRQHAAHLFHNRINQSLSGRAFAKRQI